jgi:DNA-binding Lrp family transcriptional regulator
MQDIDQRDRELLNALQEEVPLASTPFAIIGQQIEMSEKEVIKRTERLKRDGIIRQLGAHFDMRSLGYRSSLVAARVQEERVEQAAGIISAHPGVTQNYRRNHELNLWYTIAVGPTSRLGLEKTIELLGEEAGCEIVRPLPTLKLYKSSGVDGSENHAEPDTEPAPLTAPEVECVRILQREFPLQPRPFDLLSRTASMPAEEIIVTAKALFKRGAMRRFAATVPARQAGFSASAMGVWAVPADRTDEVAAILGASRAVSHCYLRPVYEDWPYNLYTTVHGRSIDECESIINDLATDCGIDDKRALYRTREYKQARISYFSPEADEWEALHTSSHAVAAS